MQKRKLGRTNEYLTMVGFGGILVMNEDQETANRLVAQAVEERGINYFDVAPSYGDAQDRLGPALEPYRDSVFLACKTGERLAAGVQAELERSLQQLRTDHFDLYQFHGVRSMADVEQITGPGGALEAFVRARERGQVRYLGFSAHSEEAALALMDRVALDTILFPFNWVAWHQGQFGRRVLARAQEKGLGILALKALAKHKLAEGAERVWPKCWYAPVASYEEASLALRFTLSRPITAAVSPGHAQFLWWACDAAERFVPLSPEDEAEVARRTQGLEPIFPQ
ncbi:MAG: aldo/keto reductase [Chloroflexi bacterium]|nr:aldo/keto reductase [Chloroflexota bacterium]